MSETDFKTWTVPDSPLAVEYSPQVLDKIRLAAAFSGVEIGGVLFGDRGENLVRILTWRPMECQLSEPNKFALSKQLIDAKSDPELSVLHPVGWFVSQARGEIHLTEANLEIYAHFFPWSWQITLIVQPMRAAGANMGILARASDGSIKIGLLQLPAVAKKSNPAYNRIWLWAALLILAAITPAAFLWKPQAAPPASISFHIVDNGDTLQFAWDKNAGRVREATRGALDIRDGNSTVQVALDVPRLRAGAFPYARKSGDLQVLLTLFPAKGPPVQESARLLAASAGSEETAGLRRERDSLAAQVSSLQQSLRKETNRNQELQRKLRLLENKPPLKRARRANSNRRAK